MAGSHSDTDLGAVPDDVWETARAREKVIRAVLSDWPDVGDRREIIRAAASELGITPQYCYRLIKAYKSDPRTRSLLPRRPGPKPGTRRALPAAVEAIINDEIQNFYLTRLKPKKTALVKGIHARCAKENLPKPAKDTILNRLAAISKREQTKRREGGKAARDGFQPVQDSLSADRPLQIVQVDHTLANVMAIELETGEVIGRPFITLAQDVCTRMYCGVHITFDPPSIASVAACLAHAVMDKSEWLRIRQLPDVWPVAGLCETLHLDNAKEFHSGAFTRACEDYGIDVRHRRRRSPQDGGHIERRIGHLSQDIHMLDGTTFSNIQERGAYNSEGCACLSIREIEWMIASMILEHHAQSHAGLNGMSPLAAWKSMTADCVIRRPQNEQVFYRDFLPFEERTVQRDGLHLFGIRYWHDGLAAYLNDKAKLTVHYDPANLSVVFVRSRAGGYIEVPYRALRRPPVSKWEWRAAQRAARREGRATVDEELVFDMVLRRRALLEEARTRKRQARRELARSGMRKPLLPLVPTDVSQRETEPDDPSDDDVIVLPSRHDTEDLDG